MKYNINDEVWFIDCWDNIDKGKILTTGKTFGDVIVYTIQSYLGEVNIIEDDIFLTEKDAKAEKEKRFEIAKEDYKKRINTLEDLLRFMLTNMYCEERDYEAIAASKEKIKEITGLEME